MISFIPSEVQQQVSEILDLFLQKKPTLVDFSRASGGCINNGGRLITAEGNFFVKWNDAVRFPGMFKAEQSGLNLLRESCEIQVPRCIGRFESAINHLEEALEHYNSPRTEEFSRVLLLSVIETPMDSTQRESYVKRLQSLRKKHLMTLAQAR